MFLASPVAPASFGAWRNLELQPVAANHRGVLKLLEHPDAERIAATRPEHIAKFARHVGGTFVGSAGRASPKQEGRQLGGEGFGQLEVYIARNPSSAECH